MIVDFHGLKRFSSQKICLKAKGSSNETNKVSTSKDFFQDNNSESNFCILIWETALQPLFSSLELTHSRAAKVIFDLDSFISDADCLLNSHWPSVSCFYETSVLVFMHKVYFDSLSFWPDELFSKKVTGKSLRAI